MGRTKTLACTPRSLSLAVIMTRERHALCAGRAPIGALSEDVFVCVLAHVAALDKAAALNAFARDDGAVRVGDAVLALGAVDRRFRRVVRRTHASWAIATNRMPSARRRLFLALSGDSPLVVIVHALRAESRTEDEERFLRDVAGHQPRWGEFYAHMDGAVGAASVPLPIDAVLPGLTIACFSWAARGDGERDSLGPAPVPFFARWTTPALRRLIMAHEVDGADMLRTVPDLALVLTCRTDVRRQFWAPLAVCAALSTLELSFVDLFDGHAWMQDAQPTRIESVTTLTLLAQQTPADTVRLALGALHLPLMAHVIARIDASTFGGSEVELLQAIFAPLQNAPIYASVVSVDFALGWGAADDGFSHIFTDVCALRFFFGGPRFPSLHTLALRVMKATFGPDLANSPLTIPDSLRLLDLADVRSLPDWVFEHLCDHLARHNTVMRLSRYALRGFKPFPPYRRCVKHYQQVVSRPDTRLRVDWADDATPLRDWYVPARCP